MIQFSKKEDPDPYQTQGEWKADLGGLRKKFSFRSKWEAQEFALELIQSEKEESLSLCIVELDEVIEVLIGFVKTGIRKANSLARKIDELYKERKSPN